MADRRADPAGGRQSAAIADTEEAVANLYLMDRQLGCPDTPVARRLRPGARYGKERKTTREQLKTLVPLIKKKTRSTFTRKMLYKRLPVLSWLPRYNAQDAFGDLVAGLTVGLTVIPQSLAYANIAGLPAQYGLYSSFVGCILYIVLGSCKDVPMGPTALVSLLNFQMTKGLPPEYSVLLCFLMGCVEVVMGLLGLGFMIDFVSGPVNSGFTSAGALIIITSQVRDLVGIEASGRTFVDNWESIFGAASDVHLWDTVLGVSCIVVLLLLRLLAKVEIGPKEKEKQTWVHRITNKTLWLIGTSRNAIIVIVCGIIGYFSFTENESPLILIGHIPAGLPAFQLPPFAHDNGNSTVGFYEMATTLGWGIILLPLVGLLENMAVCKAFSSGQVVDATQELIALGVSNIGNSFVQGFPGSGSLSRSAVQNSSGVRTPLAGLYTGALVVLALLFFTPYFFYIPKTSLAAVIIAAVIFVVEVHVVIPMWKTKKSDLIPGIGTFVACLVLALELGILIGIGINVLFILYHVARPKIAIENCATREGVEYLLLTPDRCLIFPSVDYMRNLVMKHSMKQNLPVVIDCSHIYSADYTAAKVIECLIHDFSARRQALFFFNLKPSVVSVFQGLQPKGFLVFYEESELDDLVKAYNKGQVESETIKDMSFITVGDD
ncbi:sodium-independent sulfate anion transporter-like isoform X2 [Bacillus rossius redtenbacheri]|uniref:sodium-independent sulfate anion transporter-like isoform X2 n=1 Tax=Bacillus rossius redtenbacheri TaxID=93214 RepID=UPI002FDCB40A